MNEDPTPPIDVVQRDSDYVLFCGATPLLTPENREIAYRSPRPLEHLQQEWHADGTSSSLALHVFRTALILHENDPDPATAGWDSLLSMDPLIDKAAFDAALNRSVDHQAVTALMDDHIRFALFFNGLANAIQCFNRFLLDFTEGHIDFTRKDAGHLTPLLFQAYQSMSAEEKSAVHVLASVHACGLLLPMLLVLRRITTLEYVNALFGLYAPGLESSEPTNPFRPLLAAPAELTTELPDWHTPETSLDHLRRQVWSVLDYVQSSDPVHANRFDVMRLIRGGENFNTEFKTTLRWNVKAERKDPAIEHASLKTVNAFLNSSGGYLLIGVRDDGSIEGLNLDQFPNEDKFALHFWNLIKSGMGQEVSTLIRTTFEPVGDRLVFAVHCSPSPQPVFLQQKGQEDEFYVRVGPSSAKLSVKEALHYIAARFHNP